jgi:hypothetical protein
MVLDGLPEGHLVLSVLGILSLGHEILVLEDLSTRSVLLVVAMLDSVAVSRIVLRLSKARHLELA